MTYTRTPSGAFIPARDVVVYTDDFGLGNNTSTTAGDLRWIYGAGTATVQTPDVNHPGIIRWATGASSGTNVGARASAGLAFDADGFFDMMWVARLNTNDSDTLVRFGCGDSVSAPGNGAYVEKLEADTQWHAVTRASSAETRTALADVSTGWVRFRLRRISATQIGFQMDSAAEVVHTANIPNSSVHPWFQLRNNAAADKTLDLDYFQLIISGINR